MASALAPLASEPPELLNPVLVVSIEKGYRVQQATALGSLLFSVPPSSPPLNLSGWSVSAADNIRLRGAPAYVDGTDVVELQLEFDAADLVDATTPYTSAVSISDAETGAAWVADASLHVTSMASSAVWLPQRLLTTSGACASASGDDDDWNATERGSLLCPCRDAQPLIDTYWDTGEALWADGLSGSERGNVTYPYSYGVGCGAHDQHTAPYCDDADGDGVTPSWCADRWCYVETASCSLPTGGGDSSYFVGMQGMLFSYITCGDKDQFSATKGASSLVMCNALGHETSLEVIADRSAAAAFFICDAFNMTQVLAPSRDEASLSASICKLDDNGDGAAGGSCQYVEPEPKAFSATSELSAAWGVTLRLSEVGAYQVTLSVQIWDAELGAWSASAPLSAAPLDVTVVCPEDKVELDGLCVCGSAWSMCGRVMRPSW